MFDGKFVEQDGFARSTEFFGKLGQSPDHRRILIEVFNAKMRDLFLKGRIELLTLMGNVKLVDFLNREAS